MSIKKTKNGTYQLKIYVPSDVRGKLGLGQYYEKRFKTKREAREAELKFAVNIEKQEIIFLLIKRKKSLLRTFINKFG